MHEKHNFANLRQENKKKLLEFTLNHEPCILHIHDLELLSVARRVKLKNKNKKINLFPIELGYKLPRPQRGRPVIAREENKQRIINKLADLSSDFGTEIQYSERGVGEVILK